VVYAQPEQAKDSTAQDSAALVQFEMAQSYSQGKVDSMLRVRLEAELEANAANVQKSQQLEAELAKIRVADSLRKRQQQDKLDQLRKANIRFPVAPFGDTLFYVHLRLGSTAPESRASNISERIQEVYEDNFFAPDSLVVVANEWGHELDYKKGETILNVSTLDALWYDKGSEALALEYRSRIIDAIRAEKEENSLLNWLRRIGLVMLIVLGASLVIFGINKGFNRLHGLVRQRQTPFLKRGIYKGIHLLTPEYQKLVVGRLIEVLRYAVIIIALYLSLPLLFYVFPDTQDITNTLLGWIISPAKDLLRSLIQFLPNLFTILVIFVFTRYLVRGLRFFFHELDRGQVKLPGFHSDFARPTFNIVRFVLYAFMLVIIFPYLPGSSSPAFQGVSVFLGLLISLGSSSAINNIIAGLVITYMRPFKIGDRIRIGDTVGDVVEKSMLVIKVRTVKNEEITVPNSTVLSSNTTNFSALAADKGLILHTTVTIGYDVPWRDMHAALLQAAERTELILKEPAPFVLQTSLDDFYVSYQLNAYTRAASQQAQVYSELHRHILDSCAEAGIEIMSPHYRAMRDGNASTIPSSGNIPQ
jgi:small-conductance mechanosensitive channel